MNKCCKDTLQILQTRLHNRVIALMNYAGEEPKSVMEFAALKRAEIILDIMETIKKFANE